ncbi:MAG: PP2C family protein-serine/threonine phosphatase [bacterium]
MVSKGFSSTDEVKSLIEENRRLKRALEELSVLNELARTICSSMKLSDILDRVVKNCIKSLRAEQGAIFLVSENDAGLFKTLIRRGNTEEGKKPYRLGEGLSGWLIKHKKPLIIQDLKQDRRFRGFRHGADDIRSVLGVPLIARARLIGAIILFNKLASQTFTEDDQKMLSIIASQSSQVIENARLFEQELELRRLEQDLERAREIQMRLLPKESPQVKGFDLAGISYPAREVGGDYFDFIQINQHRWGIALGDVSGKGIPAALLMSNLQATLRGQALTSPSLTECVSKSNHLLYLSTDPEKFVTLFYAVLDSQNGIFQYVNAGHNFPYYLDNANNFHELTLGGPILGMLPDYPFEEGGITLSPGELVVIYSDGVTEAENELEVMLGEKRLQQTVKENKQLSARKIIDSICASINEFTGPVKQADDITIVVVKAI